MKGNLILSIIDIVVAKMRRKNPGIKIIEWPTQCTELTNITANMIMITTMMVRNLTTISRTHMSTRWLGLAITTLLRIKMKRCLIITTDNTRITGRSNSTLMLKIKRKNPQIKKLMTKKMLQLPLLIRAQLLLLLMQRLRLLLQLLLKNNKMLTSSRQTSTISSSPTTMQPLTLDMPPVRSSLSIRHSTPRQLAGWDSSRVTSIVITRNMTLIHKRRWSMTISRRLTDLMRLMIMTKNMFTCLSMRAMLMSNNTTHRSMLRLIMSTRSQWTNTIMVAMLIPTAMVTILLMLATTALIIISTSKTLITTPATPTSFNEQYRIVDMVCKRLFTWKNDIEDYVDKAHSIHKRDP